MFTKLESDLLQKCLVYEVLMTNLICPSLASILLGNLKKLIRHISLNLNKHRTLKGNNFHRIFKLCNYSNPLCLSRTSIETFLKALPS